MSEKTYENTSWSYCHREIRLQRDANGTKQINGWYSTRVDHAISEHAVHFSVLWRYTRHHKRILRTTLAGSLNVLEKLKEAGMQLNINKSYFATSSVDYLGYIISCEGIKPQASKVKIIVDMPRPKTVSQVKRFSGMINFSRDLWKGQKKTPGTHHVSN